MISLPTEESALEMAGPTNFTSTRETHENGIHLDLRRVESGTSWSWEMPRPPANPPEATMSTAMERKTHGESVPPAANATIESPKKSPETAYRFLKWTRR